MTSGVFNRKLGFALLVIFYGFYHGIHHHFSPPFGRIFVGELVPSILGKFKEMNPSLLFGACFFRTFTPKLQGLMKQVDKRSFQTNGWIQHQLGFLRFEEFWLLLQLPRKFDIA